MVRTEGHLVMERIAALQQGYSAPHGLHAVPEPGTVMLSAAAAVDALRPLGFERVSLVEGSTYRDCSTVIVIPTRGMISHRVVASWQNLMAPMNQKRAILFAQGEEVGHAYNRMIENILADPTLSTWRYVLTLEDDNLVPADAHIRLLESIEWAKHDAMAGLYFTKGPLNMPMAYGDPEEFSRTGVLEFKPRDVRQAIERGQIMEVNGVAMGCTLWRMDLFRELKPPWFVTVGDVIPEKGPCAFTQDLWFSERARRVGKRFGVDMRVHVGHLDVETGLVY
jgi:hypothetical protein